MKKITIVGPGRVGESTVQMVAKEASHHELVLQLEHLGSGSWLDRT
jgi:malate/lactate dehydrogenase